MQSGTRRITSGTCSTSNASQQTELALHNLQHTEQHTAHHLRHLQTLPPPAPSAQPPSTFSTTSTFGTTSTSTSGFLNYKRAEQSIPLPPVPNSIMFGEFYKSLLFELSSRSYFQLSRPLYESTMAQRNSFQSYAI